MKLSSDDAFVTSMTQLIHGLPAGVMQIPSLSNLPGGIAILEKRVADLEAQVVRG